MENSLLRRLRIGAICAALSALTPITSLAVVGPGFTAGTYVATITANAVNINKSLDSEEVLTTAEAGSAYEVLEDLGNGWVKIKSGSGEGYLPVSGNAELSAVGAEEMAQVQQETEAERQEVIRSSAAYKRQQLVNYALQFVGGPYQAGGSDPRTGTDCSGFTRYVMLHGAGVNLNRSSTAQSSQGVSVSADQMQPGDLLFYGSGGGINHVAMYIGNGKVVHASTERTGIKVSDWNYRTPVKIKNVLG